MTKRNYFIDVIKLIFTVFVVISHTYCFIGEKTTYINVKLCSSLGWWSVHFFFIVSGMLMVNSAMKNRNNTITAGEQALNFVVKKFSAISTEYWSALLLAITVFCVSNRNIPVFEVIIRDIPEMFGLNQIGIKTLEVNTATWYLSAMLICMLPLYYLLITRSDFFICVFAPLMAFLTFGYMHNGSSIYPAQYSFNGIVYMGIIRALNGICFGVISWIINEKIKRDYDGKRYKVILTIVEIAVWILFFGAWSTFWQNEKYMYSVMLLLPVAVGISFSGKTYLSGLFVSDKFKNVSKVSLAIYLNQIAARNIVRDHYGGLGYKWSCILMMLLLVILCMVYYILVKGIKYSKQILFQKRR